MERKGRESLFANDLDDQEGIKKRRKQKEKEDLVTQSGKATDNLASISRQLAETVERYIIGYFFTWGEQLALQKYQRVIKIEII